MGKWLQDLRFGLRHIRHRPGMAAVVMLSIAMATGPNCFLFTVLDGVLLRPTGVIELDRMYRFFLQINESAYQTISYPDYEYIRHRPTALSDAIAYLPMTAWLEHEGRQKRFAIHAVSDNYFKGLDVRPFAGRLWVERNEPSAGDSIVISHRLWMREFGSDTSILGRSVLVNGRQFAVLGVAMPGFRGMEPQVPVDIWSPFDGLRMLDPGMYSQLLRPGSQGASLLVTVRLKEGRKLDEAVKQTEALATELRALYPGAHRTARVVFSSLVSDRRQILAITTVVLCLANLVLFVACVNIASLLASDGDRRRRDTAVRASMGAGRIDLVRQFLTESLLLGAGGMALAVLMTAWLVDVVPSLLPAVGVPLDFDVAVGGRVIAYAATVCLLTVVAFGLRPARRAAEVDIASSLSGAALVASGRGPGGARGGLALCAQVASVYFLIALSAVMYTNYRESQKMDLGIAPHPRLLLLRIDELPSGKHREDNGYEALLARLRTLPGVQAAVATPFIPLSGEGDGGSVRVYPDEDEGVSVFRAWVGAGHFRILGSRIVRGREFAPEDPSSGGAIVNEALARRLWRDDDPIGKPLRLDRGFVHVIGVVQNGKISSIYEDTRPAVFFPARWTGASTLLVEASGDHGRVLESVRKEIALYQGLRISGVKTGAQMLDFAMTFSHVGVSLMSWLATLGMLLGGIGLYAVASASVTKRSREIAIRMALGARRRDVVRVVLGRDLSIIAVGVVVGACVTMPSVYLLSTVLAGVQPTAILPLTGTAAVVVALAAIAMQTAIRRALRFDYQALIRCD